MTALCMTLMRMSKPRVLEDMLDVFGCSGPQMSDVSTTLIHLLYDNYAAIFMSWDDNRLTYHKIQEYQQAIEDSTGIPMVWGFIDGTVRPIARPTHDQRMWYSGHKCYHGIKLQVITTPDGLLSSVFGHRPAPEGDWKLWLESGVMDKLRDIFKDKQLLYLYGDNAYSDSYGSLGPHSTRQATAEQIAVNARMASARIAVESGFAIVLNQFKAFEWKRSMRIQQTAVGAWFVVAILLTNCQTCLRGGNQITKRFGYNSLPPSIQEYLKTGEL